MLLHHDNAKSHKNKNDLDSLRWKELPQIAYHLIWSDLHFSAFSKLINALPNLLTKSKTNLRGSKNVDILM